jgi:hypothetical protein
LRVQRLQTRGKGDVSSDGSDPVSLSQAVADLKAMDSRLAALIATYPPTEPGRPDLGAPIRESRALVRAAIGLLAGALLSGETPDRMPGTAKRRVKIKAASDSTASGAPAGAEAAVRSDPNAPAEPVKPAARGGGPARNASAAASAAAAASAQAPPNSLLARLGAAATEPGARHPDAADGAGNPAPAPAPQPSHVSARAAAERLARLEAEIDSLTEATTTGGDRSGSAATDAPGPPVAPASRTAQSQSPLRAAASASASEYRPGVDGAGADGEDDAEIVIVTSQTGARPARQGTLPVRQSPRIFSDPSASDDDDDAEVEIVQSGTRPGGDGRAAHTPATPEGERAKAGAGAPVAPAKWRLFRGSR